MMREAIPFIWNRILNEWNFTRQKRGMGQIRMSKKTIMKRRNSNRVFLHRPVYGKKLQKVITQKSIRCRYVRKVVMLCAGVLGAGLLFMGIQAKAADETTQFQSRGVIHYTDISGQEVILDAQDLQMLFQYAAEGKEGLSRALGGVGTKLIRDGENYQCTREPGAEASAAQLQTIKELQSVSFDLLLQALAESQTLPAGYEESYTLACSDNLTLGRAAWSDGSLARGNNHDLMEHYMRGWLEGSGCMDYEVVYDEEGRWIGYREKQQ